MKIITKSLILYLLFIFLMGTHARAQNSVDSLIKVTDAYINSFRDNPRNMKIIKGLFATKVIIEKEYSSEQYSEEFLLLKQKVRYKNGNKMERAVVKYKNRKTNKNKQLLKVELINDKYIYIKRVKYKPGSWLTKDSVDMFANDDVYYRIEYN